MTDLPDYLTASSLGPAETIIHGFFTRRGGVSERLYATLNVGLGSDDRPEAVRENRSRLCDALGGGRLVTAYQVHGSTALYVTDPWNDDQRPEADALVTDQPGLLLGVVTADCAPVLLADAEAGVVAAAHAGWRGALAGIGAAAIESMISRGARKDRIRAAIGPCIQQRSYEVGDDFRDEFLDADSDYARFFAAGTADGKFQFDLAGFVEWTLIEAGLGRVEIIDADTYSDGARFFSFRRSCHRGEADFGRQISAIGLR